MTPQYFGIVEGFFSRPLPIWTWAERISTLKFISQFAPRINTYLYCPKDEPYVNANWSKPYTSRDLNQLAEFICLCQKYGIAFIYGLNPSRPDADKVTCKFNQLKGVGCQNFCLLFDDIPFAYEIIDRPDSRLGSKIGKSIVGLTNTVRQRIGPIGNLWLCTPDYTLLTPSPLTRELTNLDDNIPLIWTGNSIFASRITSADIRRVSKIVGGRKIVWWSNYPVNDCEQNTGNFNLGAFSGPTGAVIESLAGLVVNPMRECYANLPFYITLSDYLANPNSYSRAMSWSNALRTLLGPRFSPYADLFSLLSSTNALDKKRPRPQIPMYPQSSPSTSWGMRFLAAIRNLLIDYENIKKISSIPKNLPIPSGLFGALDTFPTLPSMARYFPEVCGVLVKRLALLPQKCDRQLKPRIMLLKSKFSKLLQGQKKLTLPPPVRKKLVRLSNQLIVSERKLFLSYINSITNPRKRVDLILKRRYINRFSL